jgi:hypothetical protein
VESTLSSSVAGRVGTKPQVLASMVLGGGGALTSARIARGPTGAEKIGKDFWSSGGLRNVSMLSNSLRVSLDRPRTTSGT